MTKENKLRLIEEHCKNCKYFKLDIYLSRDMNSKYGGGRFLSNPKCFAKNPYRVVITKSLFSKCDKEI